VARVDGILLLDKPAGLTSNAALQRVKRALRADKAGHTGSLDPLATGMLPLCFGEATKIAGQLLGGRKRYVAHARLGTTTTTGDADGEPLEARPVPPLDRASIEALLARYTGTIVQRPPAYSAIKRGGVPLYKLARRGVAVEAPAREVVVDALTLHAIEGDTLVLDVTCGAGTYIRSLAADVGEALGCGAHLTALRRTWAAPFEDAPMITLDAVLVATDRGEPVPLLPLEAGLSGLPRAGLDATAALLLARHGTPPRVEGLPWTGLGAAYGPDARAVALVEHGGDGVLWPRRVFAPV
jgi:tRNA pseudouridine55 synthase